MGPRLRILVLSRARIGREMGSTGIRSYHTARVLAEQLPDAQVTLAAPNEPDIASPHPRLRLVRSSGTLGQLREALRHDIIVARDFPAALMPAFAKKRFALDFYVASLVELTALSKRILDPSHRRLWMAVKRHFVSRQLTMADFVFCSNERQRDLWIGNLSMEGLIPPRVYNNDVTLRKYIDVVPYGVQPGRPQAGQPVLKGVVPGIGPSDKVVIWNGSIMEWFDAATVIRSMDIVRRKRDDVKLFFLGIEHPDYVTGLLFDPPRDAVRLSKDLDLYDSAVFFNFDWAPYGEIGRYLAEADIGVCASLDSLEHRYSSRTRLVDLFWAELPVICTKGDLYAERIERDTLGIAVEPGDADGLAGAILRLAEDAAFYDRCRGNLAAVKEELSWERALEPLVRFCRSGDIAAAPKRMRARRLALRAGLEAASMAQRIPWFARDRLGRARRAASE